MKKTNEKLQEQVLRYGSRYRKLFNEENNKKRDYGRNKYKNMSEERKQRLKQYQKTTVKQKSQHNFFFFSYSTRMGGKSMISGDRRIRKTEFNFKKTININDVDINKINGK